MGKRCIVAGYPPGCSGGWDSLLPLPEERGELVYEKRGSYYIVRQPVKAVFREDVFRELLECIEKPRNLLLLGPPGTGKSMFIEVLRAVAKANVIEVNPESILSKYVGETEQRFEESLRLALENPPALVLIDEGDLVIRSRMFTGGRESETANLSANLVRILLRYTQMFSDIGEIGVVISSNLPLSAIDPALTRSKRFRVLYFPVPDREAARLVFELYGKQPPSDEVLDTLIMLAPSYANLVEYVTKGRLSEFEIAPFVKIFSVPRPRCEYRVEHGNVIIVMEPHPVSAVVAALHSSLVHGRPVILLLDPERYEDAVWLSKTMRFPLAVPYSPYIHHKLYSIIYRTSEPVYLIGQEWGEYRLEAIDANTLTSVCGEYVIKEILGCEVESLKACLARRATSIVGGVEL